MGMIVIILIGCGVALMMVDFEQFAENPDKVEPCKIHSWCWDEVKEQRWCTVCQHVVKLEDQ